MVLGMLICTENFQSVKARLLSIFLWIHSLQFLELYYPTPKKRKYQYVSQMKSWLPKPEVFETPSLFPDKCKISLTNRIRNFTN